MLAPVAFTMRVLFLPFRSSNRPEIVPVVLPGLRPRPIGPRFRRAMRNDRLFVNCEGLTVLDLTELIEVGLSLIATSRDQSV